MKKLVCPRPRNAVNRLNPARQVSLLAALALPLFLSAGANAAVLNYQAFLDGPSESPPNASPGTGYVTVDYDNVLHTLHLVGSFTGLTGVTTLSHIHAATTLPLSGTAGVATTAPFFAGFPTGVTSGSFNSTLDLTQSSSYNGSYVTANGGTTATAEVALTSAIATGRAYFNIHTSTFGGGEIRGFLVPIPEPSALALAGCAGAALLAWRRKNS